MRGRRSRIALAIAVVAGLIGLGFEGASVASADGEPAGRPAAYCAVWDALRPYDGRSASGVALPDGTLVDADVVHAELAKKLAQARTKLQKKARA